MGVKVVIGVMAVRTCFTLQEVELVIPLWDKLFRIFTSVATILFMVCMFLFPFIICSVLVMLEIMFYLLNTSVHLCSVGGAAGYIG